MRKRRRVSEYPVATSVLGKSNVMCYNRKPKYEQHAEVVVDEDNNTIIVALINSEVKSAYMPELR